MTLGMLTLTLLLLCGGCAEATLTGAAAEPIEVQTYRVEYVDQTKRELARGKVGSGSPGTEIVERPLVIAGYAPTQQELRATLKPGENLVMRFYYDAVETSKTEETPLPDKSAGKAEPILFIGGMTLLLFLVGLRMGRKRTKK